LEVACNLDNLGSVAQAEGAYTTAFSLYAQSLAIRQEVGMKRGIACSVMTFAGLAMVQGHSEQAVRLWRAAESIRATLGLTLLPTERERYDRDRTAVRATLDEERFGIAWKEGQAMTLEQAVAYALQKEIV
jgi:hypothetical protein